MYHLFIDYNKISTYCIFFFIFSYILMVSIMKEITAYLIIFICSIILFFSNITYEASYNALLMFFDKLVPSLFISMFVVRFLYYTNSLSYILKPLYKIFNKIFNTSNDSLNLIVSCLFLGFPSSASLINEQYINNNIDRKGALRLIYCISIATPAFIISTVGFIIFNNVSIGLSLFGIQIIIIFILLFFTRGTRIDYNASSNSYNVFNSIKLSISNSITTLGLIAGYLMIALSIGAIINILTNYHFTFFISSILEFSSGILNSLAYIYTANFEDAILFVSCILGFGGLCVHLQVMMLSYDIKPKYFKYLGFRIIQVILTYLIIYIGFVLL